MKMIMKTNLQCRVLVLTFIFAFAARLQNCSSNKVGIQYSSKETLALEKFRKLVSDALYADYMNTDRYLIRWLRDGKFNLEKANTKLRKCLEWRKRNGIDNIFEDPVLQKLNKTYPINVSGYDRAGSPVLTVAPGSWKIRQLTLRGLGPALTRHLASLFELGLIQLTKLEREGRNATEAIALVDLSGYGLRGQACLACLPVFTNIPVAYEAYYVEQLKGIIAINVPKIFDSVLQLIKTFLAPQTREMLKVYGTKKEEWQKAILERISPEQLTTQYGGTRSIIRN